MSLYQMKALNECLTTFITSAKTLDLVLSRSDFDISVFYMDPHDSQRFSKTVTIAYNIMLLLLQNHWTESFEIFRY